MVFIVTLHFMNQFRAVDYTVTVTQITQLNSPGALGLELGADFKVKTKTSRPCSSPGPGLETTGLYPVLDYCAGHLFCHSNCIWSSFSRNFLKDESRFGCNTRCEGCGAEHLVGVWNLWHVPSVPSQQT
uniref:Uncharacterized protein n=1 Tax=Anguilla anguilla TaxID=7936 RepID=A0A0E9WJV4_ANGAN